LKLKDKAEEGMERKFSLFQPVDSEDIENEVSKLLDQTYYSVTMRIEAFRRELMRFDLADVFTIASSYAPNADFDGDDFPEAGARPIDLLDSYNDVELETIKKASKFFMERGKSFHVENLLWSGTKLLNSCDKKLRQKIKKRQFNTLLLEHHVLCLHVLLTKKVETSLYSKLWVKTMFSRWQQVFLAHQQHN
jgi:hypothetical protein